MNDIIKLSKMSGKLKNVPSINTNTVTNDFCIKMNKSNNDKCICKYCYSHNMLNTFRKNCQKSFQHNSNLLKTILSDNQLPIIKNNDILRINSHGEIINDNHVRNIIKICELNKNITVSLYTKRINIVNKVLDEIGYKPNNLIIVYSNPIIDKPIDKKPSNKFYKYVDKIFNVLSTDNNKINCDKNNCDNCRICYNKNKTNIIYEKIK